MSDILWPVRTELSREYQWAGCSVRAGIYQFFQWSRWTDREYCKCV